MSSAANPPAKSPAPEAPKAKPTPEQLAADAAHIAKIAKEKTANERTKALCRRDPRLKKVIAEISSAGEQAAADLVTAKATIASLEAIVTERDAELASLREQLAAALSKPAAGKPSGKA